MLSVTPAGCATSGGVKWRGISVLPLATGFYATLLSGFVRTIGSFKYSWPLGICVERFWLFCSGISDLVFAFDVEDVNFDYHASFFEIMALEKHFKAALIFCRKKEFIGLEPYQAQERAIKLAKLFSHRFEDMARVLEAELPSANLGQLLDGNYQGFEGRKLLAVLSRAYMEVRYPTVQGVHRRFPSSSEAIYFNPLGSSGLSEFVRAICRGVTGGLQNDIDIVRVRRCRIVI
jgi:hypothetical protein